MFMLDNSLSVWYIDNWFNFVNSTNPDTSGMLRFLTDELQAAEDAGQRGTYFHIMRAQLTNQY